LGKNHIVGIAPEQGSQPSGVIARFTLAETKRRPAEELFGELDPPLITYTTEIEFDVGSHPRLFDKLHRANAELNTVTIGGDVVEPATMFVVGCEFYTAGHPSAVGSG